jgi:UDP-glucose 4-epimerase
LSNSFGAPVMPDVNRWTLLVNDLCRQAATTHQLKLLSNGCQYRDFVSLSDVEEAVLQLLSRAVKRENIVNLSAGKSLTVLDMAGLIADCYREEERKEIPVLLPENVKPSKESEVTISNSRLTAMGYEVKNDYTSEIKALLQFCKKHFSLS